MVQDIFENVMIIPQLILLKHNISLNNTYKTQFDHTENTPNLYYKDQEVNAVYGNNRSLFREGFTISHS
jgi:hypothetical protein